jgi:uncharacterized protein (DUF111 family)
MRIGYLECFSGISGDMMLGVLVDAGVPFSLFEQTTAALDLGAKLEMRKVLRGGLSATKIDVIIESAAEPHHEHSHEMHVQDHQHEHLHGEAHTHAHEHTHADGTVHSHEHSHQQHRSLSGILELINRSPIPDSVKTRATRAFQLLGEAEAGIHSMPIEQVHFHEIGAVDTIVDLV